MLKDYKYGSVISWAIPPANLSFPNNIFDYAQVYLTGEKETHSSILLDRQAYFEGNIYVKKDLFYEYEASTTTRVNIFRGNQYATVYGINAPRSILEPTINYLIEKYYGRIYNFPQLAYFVFRRIMESLSIDVRRWYNPLGLFFLICSELVYYYLEIIAHGMNWLDLLEYLHQWRANNYSSGDNKNVLLFMINKNYAFKY